MGLVETKQRPAPKGYINPLALTEHQVLHSTLVQDRNRVGKIRDEYYAASLNREFEKTKFPRDMLRAVRDAQAFDPQMRGQVIRSLVHDQGYGRDDLADKKGDGQLPHEVRDNIEGARSREFVEIYEEELRKWSHPKRKGNTHLAYFGGVDITADGFSAIAQEAFDHPEILREKVFNEDLKRPIRISKAARAAIGWVTRSILYGPVVARENDKVKAMIKKTDQERLLPFYENWVLRPLDGAAARLNELQRRVKRQPREYLLESQRVNGLGIYFQNITDGGLSTMHTSPGREGLLGNYHKPIAYLEVQIGAVNALENAARLYPSKTPFYKNLAQKVRESTMRQFYMPDKKYFAAAVDRDEVTGKYRQVEALSIMGASILNSDFFDGLPETEKRSYIEPIVERLTSPDFLTDAGIRTKNKQNASLIIDPDNPNTNAVTYQDSWNVWPALNEDFILGLRRQGLHGIAEQIENRVVNFVHANSNAEFAFVVPGDVIVNGNRVNLDGLIAQNYKTKKELESLSEGEKMAIIGDRQIIYLSAPYPQGDQLWTASAVARVEYERENNLNLHTTPHSWQDEVEKNTFSPENYIPILEGNDLKAFGDNPYFFVIDAQRGTQIEERLREESEKRREQLRSRRYAA